MSILARLKQWDDASEHEQEWVVQRIAGALAPKLAFQRFETYSLGDQRHRIAIFQWRTIEFALLPGYCGSLGIDTASILNLIRPHISQGLSGTGAEAKAAQWMDYLARVLTPIRSVALLPFLVQRVPESLEVLQQQPDGGYLALPSPTHDDTLAAIRQKGFDLSTSDEWEYACSGGARTLFRWGDVWPDAPWTAAQRIRMHHPPEPPSDWAEDQRVNAFGLHIAQNPWNLEYCREPGVIRGGDGGTADSSGAEPYFAQWLPLATAYQYPFKARMTSRLRRPYQRRVLHLDGNDLD